MDVKRLGVIGTGLIGASVGLAAATQQNRPGTLGQKSLQVDIAGDPIQP